MRLELGHLDAVDGRPRLCNFPDVLFRHLANPQHAMPLQAGMCQIDRAVIERPAKVRARDQDCV